MNGDAIWSNVVGTGFDVDKLKNKVTSVNGKTGEVELTADDVKALSQDKLQDGVNLALKQAKESGEFNGEKGDKGDKGDAFTYEDFTDEQLESLKGNDYVLTESDKQEIAGMIPIPDIPESDGTNDYTQLTNKPKINGVELNGDLTLEELGLNVGGEEWELIQDFTIEEDCNEGSYNVDLQGNSFELKKAIVIVYYKKATAEDANNTGWGVSFSNSPSWNGPIMCKVKENSTFTFCAEEIDRRLYVSNLAVSYNAAMDNSLGYGSNLSYYWGRGNLNQDTNSLPMDRIKVGSYAKAMGAGTRIVLLGIRK